MRLYTFVENERQRVGLQVGADSIVDLTKAYTLLLERNGNAKAEQLAAVMTPPDMLDFLRGEAQALSIATQVETFARGDLQLMDRMEILYKLSGARLCAPIPQPPKILGVALNNRKLEDQLGVQRLLHPLFFMKQSNAVIGSGESVEIPDIGIVHQEIELALIMGRSAKNVNRLNAMDYIAGYTVFNDLTAADLRDKEEKMPAVSLSYTGRYKNFDTFAPLGPCIVTKDELANPNKLRIVGKLAGTVVQKGNTEEYLFSVEEIVEWISHVQTLPVGTIIGCGTVSFMADGGWRGCDLRSKAGAKVEGEVEGIGVLENPIKAI